jgi:hypothetical protein
MDKWIVVTIGEGLFPNERTVQLPTVDGVVSLFVSVNQIDEARHALKVRVLDEDERYALVQVPSQGGGTVAKVERAAVS